MDFLESWPQAAKRAVQCPYTDSRSLMSLSGAHHGPDLHVESGRFETESCQQEKLVLFHAYLQWRGKVGIARHNEHCDDMHA